MARPLNRKTLAAVLNLFDPVDQDIDRHVRKFPNTSKYLKSLILRDMAGEVKPFITAIPNIPSQTNPPMDVSRDLIESLV